MPRLFGLGTAAKLTTLPPSERIRRFLDRRPEGVEFEVRELAEIFHLPALMAGDRRAIQRALAKAGVLTDPPLSELEEQDFVALSLAANGAAATEPAPTPASEDGDPTLVTPAPPGTAPAQPEPAYAASPPAEPAHAEPTHADPPPPEPLQPAPAPIPSAPSPAGPSGASWSPFLGSAKPPSRLAALRSGRLPAPVAAAAAAGILVFGGGFLVGKAGGADIDGARAEGKRAGQTDGARRGTRAGYKDGLKVGRRDGYRKTYRKAFNEACRKAVKAQATTITPEQACR